MYYTTELPEIIDRRNPELMTRNGRRHPTNKRERVLLHRKARRVERSDKSHSFRDNPRNNYQIVGKDSLTVQEKRSANQYKDWERFCVEVSEEFDPNEFGARDWALCWKHLVD